MVSRKAQARNARCTFAARSRKTQQEPGRRWRGCIVRVRFMGSATRGKKTAIVIGCGIGGPVMAMALRRAGIEPVVYEAHDGSAHDVGSFLNTATNGLDALRAIGVDGEVLAGGFPTPRMVMWSYTGKRLGEVANGVPLEDGTVSITIKRGLLHRALRDEAVRRGIRIEHGKRLVDAEMVSDKVVARFEDGTQATGDLLIGADGIHSRVRRIVDPSCPAPRYTGQLSIGGIARGTSVAPTLDEYHMIFGKRAFFGYSVPPSGEAYWFANVASEEAPTREALAAISPEEWKRRLRALFAKDAGPAIEMIDGTGHELAAYPIYDIPTVRIWHRDAMVLVGDAAHATSPSAGQGASLAIEDAVVLARCLRDMPDREQAFVAYERARRARVEKVVQYSRRVGSSKVAGPIGRFFRDLMIPAALKLFAGSISHAWLYRYHIDWDEPMSAPSLR
ncbi:MAG: FAD-dependent monooxygenase [Minicystis sp.]